jgi:hypothetical protein
MPTAPPAPRVWTSRGRKGTLGRRCCLLWTCGAERRLSLADRGSHHEPVNAPFELRIPDRGAGEITLGATPREAVTITPLGRADGDAAATTAGRVFWSETARDTDTLVAPTSSGAETFEQLRGPEAPERFEYALELPHGGQLEPTGDGGFAVTREAETLLRVAPPVAADADGQDVPARLVQTEAGLALEVDHRRDGVRYPVLADPQWVSTYSFTSGDGFEGWSSESWSSSEGSSSPASDTWYHVFGTTEPGSVGHPEASGLWIIPRGGKNYYFDGARNSGPLAMAVFWAPGNGTISRVIFNNVRYSAYENPTTGKFDGQSMRLGVCCNGPEWPMLNDYVGPNWEVYNEPVDSGPLPWGVKRAMFWMFTSGCGLGNDCTWTVPAANKGSWAQVGGVQIILDDPEAPTTWHTGPLTTRGTTWVNAATGPLAQTLWATDPTSGLTSVASQVQLRGAGYHNSTGVQQPSCDSHHHTPGRQGAICAQGVEEHMTWNPADLPSAFAGWINFRPYASDYAGNASYGATHTIWVDRTSPRASFSGELWDARDSWLRDPAGHQLRLAGTDNTVAGESGIARYRIEHSHQPDTGEPTTGPDQIDDYNPCPTPNAPVSPPADWQPCPSAGPTRTLAGLDLPEGRNRFHGHVTDHAGNYGQPGAGQPAFDVYIDATRPQLALAGTLADLDGTWGAPEGVLDLAPQTTDELSGVKRLTAEITQDEHRIADLVDEDLCPAPTMPSLDPCPRTPAQERLSVSADELPEGRVQVDVNAHDLAGNRRSRSLELHVDRTAPTVELSGEILQLDQGWQDPERPITATVSASDNLSGIKAVELWVRDANGREQLLEREQVCDETAAYTGDGAPCPLDVVTTFAIDPSRLPDGRNTYFARASEFAGKRARDDLTIDVDNTPPNAPTNLQVAATGIDGATLSWQPGPEPPADAGISHYVVTVVVDGVRVTENISPHPYTKIGGIPPGIKVEFLVKAVDRLNRASHGRGASIKGRARARTAQQFSTCVPREGSSESQDLDPTVDQLRDFRWRTTRLHTSVHIWCQQLQDEKYLKVDAIKVTAWYVYHPYGAKDKRVRRLGPTSTWYIKDPPQRQDIIRTIRLNCEPRIGGSKTYRIQGKIKYYRSPAARDITRDYHTEQFKLGCPTTEERRIRQAKGFADLAHYSVDLNNDRWYRNPAEPLRDQLTEEWAPRGTIRPWAAHHMTPHSASGARTFRALLFRCRVHPNSYLNGFYLRDEGLRKVRHGRRNPAYKELKEKRPDLAARTHHYDTFGQRYVDAVRPIFGATPEADDSCNAPRRSVKDVRPRVLSALHQIRSKLAVGEIGTERKGN